MICPKCRSIIVTNSLPNTRGKVGIIDARPVHRENAFRRRWQCSCGHRFTTMERIVAVELDDEDAALMMAMEI